MRILIIEDDRTIATNLYDFLESRGHSVDAALDGISGFRLASTQMFDAILLDLKLPHLDGVTLCQRLRQESQIDIPILMLTARDTLEDKLVGFESGADDYLIKPFALKEVEARLIAMHKRYKGKMAIKKMEIGDLSFDPKTLLICFKGHEVKLPPKCMRLLTLMMSDPDRVFSRKDLELGAWEEEQETSDTLRTHMHILRRTLIQVGGYDPIETVHGLGYCLVSHVRDQD